MNSNLLDDLMYQAGMTAQGCWDNLDDYDKEAILRLAKLIVQECVKSCGSQADKANILKTFGLPVESNVKYISPEASGSVDSQYRRRYNLAPTQGVNND
jgi:hypothetical protein